MKQSDDQKNRRQDRKKSQASRTASAARHAPVASPKDSGEESREPRDSQPLPESISESEFRARVARKAFELYEGRGGESGNEIDDWVQAERLVREELTSGGDRREPA